MPAYRFKGKRSDCGSAEGYIEVTNFCYENLYKTGKAHRASPSPMKNVVSPMGARRFSYGANGHRVSALPELSTGAALLALGE